MAKPAAMAPAKPLPKIIRSAGAKRTRLAPRLEKEADGDVKYSVNFTLSTISNATTGYTAAMIHVIRNSIFNKNPIPKNKTKNNNMEMSRTGIVIGMALSSSHSLLTSLLNGKWSVNQEMGRFHDICAFLELRLQNAKNANILMKKTESN